MGLGRASREMSGLDWAVTAGDEWIGLGRDSPEISGL